MSFSTTLLSTQDITQSGATAVIGGTPIVKGMVIYVTVADKSGTSPTLDIKLQALDPASGNWFDLTGAAMTQITTAGSYQAVVYPLANGSIYPFLPANARLYYTIGGSNTPTFNGVAIGASFIQ